MLAGVGATSVTLAVNSFPSVTVTCSVSVIGPLGRDRRVLYDRSSTGRREAMMAKRRLGRGR